MKKFKLTSETKNVLGTVLFQIEALIDFADVKAGDKGGYVEKEGNLDQSGDAWVYGNAMVSGNAWVSGDACVYGNARVYGNAWVSGDACVNGDVAKRSDLVTVGLIGSRLGSTTYNIKSDEVVCGCFNGTLEEFRNKVADEYESDNKHYREYQAAIQLFEVRKELEKAEGED